MCPVQVLLQVRRKEVEIMSLVLAGRSAPEGIVPGGGSSSFVRAGLVWVWKEEAGEESWILEADAIFLRL